MTIWESSWILGVDSQSDSGDTLETLWSRGRGLGRRDLGNSSQGSAPQANYRNEVEQRDPSIRPNPLPLLWRHSGDTLVIKLDPGF